MSVYLADLAATRAQGNERQAGYIRQDLAIFAGEIDHLVTRHRRACERHERLA